MKRSLSPREVIILAAGGAVLLLLVIVFGIITPYQQGLRELDTRIASRQRQLETVRQLRSEYLELKQQAAQVDRRAARDGNFSLFPFVEATTLNIAARENLVYLRPQPAAQEGDMTVETVEVKLEKIRLDQLVRLLYASETANALLRVKSLRTRARFDDPTLIDAVLVISSYGRNS